MVRRYDYRLRLDMSFSNIYIGPNILGISADVPEGCTVDQVAYVVRHGSRYPDNGAYQEWVDMHKKVSWSRNNTHSTKH